MITKINLNKVASYKSQTILETDKRVNLIYGLNGSGKSTLSNCLYKKTDSRFKDCSIEGLTDEHDVLVYNQTFVQDNFFESESLKGIFTLSKENKEAETEILKAESEIKRIDGEKLTQEKNLEKVITDFAEKNEKTKSKVWEIKRNYSGGDRVLEFALEGFKNDGNKLLSHLESLKKPALRPEKTIEVLKEEVQAVAGENSQKYNQFALITFTANKIEVEPIFSKQIVGNDNSTVSEVINKLGSSDWVKEGLKYLPTEIGGAEDVCPFCQESTISKNLIKSLKDYFDETYEADLKKLTEAFNLYQEALTLLPEMSGFEVNPKSDIYKKDFEIRYKAFLKIVNDNLKLIQDKIKSPSLPVSLLSSSKALEDLNLIIIEINSVVVEHNQKLDHKELALNEIKAIFWDRMRWDYDHTIATYIDDKATFEKDKKGISKMLEDYREQILKQKAIIAEQQKQTVNIEEAIININAGLIDLGIEDFAIKHYKDSLYKIIRGEIETNVFQSLSEGEKMIISFLYFLELCKGKRDYSDTGRKKIVVIDDPISSLSHIYVFNVGRLIHKEFLRKNNYSQIFILTHSLYFFYELTNTKKEERDATQNLFRIRKNSCGSEIVRMKYEEIQNDYHAYWFVIKDEQQPPALIANCMRNIIEYFFNFVEKKDLNNVFQKPAMQENRFQAFCRYINRESHSLGQNIFDIKEFNYLDFKDAFSIVFKENGYAEHYKRMMK